MIIVLKALIEDRLELLRKRFVIVQGVGFEPTKAYATGS